VRRSYQVCVFSFMCRVYRFWVLRRDLLQSAPGVGDISNTWGCIYLFELCAVSRVGPPQGLGSDITCFLVLSVVFGVRLVSFQACVFEVVIC
jgi:hypothetical protein